LVVLTASGTDKQAVTLRSLGSEPTMALALAASLRVGRHTQASVSTRITRRSLLREGAVVRPLRGVTARSYWD
jgi:hypothetical protein